MKHPAIQQYNYHKWANQRVFDRLKELPAEVYIQQIQSVFSSIRKVLEHLYQVDGMWLSVMSGDDFSETMEVIQRLKEESNNLSLSDIEALFEELHHQYHTFLHNHEELDRDITIKHPHYGAMDTQVSQLVKHVVNHGTYHRGNITAMLRQQEHKGVPTDYILYLYELTKNE